MVPRAPLTRPRDCSASADRQIAPHAGLVVIDAVQFCGATQSFRSSSAQPTNSSWGLVKRFLDRHTPSRQIRAPTRCNDPHIWAMSPRVSTVRRRVITAIFNAPGKAGGRHQSSSRPILLQRKAPRCMGALGTPGWWVRTWHSLEFLRLEDFNVAHTLGPLVNRSVSELGGKVVGVVRGVRIRGVQGVMRAWDAVSDFGSDAVEGCGDGLVP